MEYRIFDACGLPQRAGRTGKRREPMRTRGILFLAVLVPCFLTSPAGAKVWEVSLQDFHFTPNPLEIAVGDSVHWQNLDQGVTHTVTSGTACTASGLFNSGDLSTGSGFGFTFHDLGVVPYFCIHHCLGGMTGQITVLTNTPVQPETWGRIRSLYR
jgi:plastocyanin